MIDEQVEGVASPDDWGKRRGSIRHEVSLPAIVVDRKGYAVACTIEDISSTGMALKIDLKTPEPGREALDQGSSGRLEFSVKSLQAGQHKVQVPVQIMWRTPTGMGVRFKRNDESLRDALKIIGAIGATCIFPFQADELYGQHEHALAQGEADDAVEHQPPELGLAVAEPEPVAHVAKCIHFDSRQSFRKLYFHQMLPDGISRTHHACGMG